MAYISSQKKDVQPIKNETDLKNIFKWFDLKIESRTYYQKGRFLQNWKRNKLIFIIGINLGLRIGDILDLRFSDFSNSHVRIKNQKTKKKDNIIVPPLIKKEILLFCKEFDIIENDFIFSNCKNIIFEFGTIENQKMITRQALNRVFKDIQKDLKLNYNINTHSLRKTFGYRFYKQTKDLEALRIIFNHSNQQVTRRYIGISEEEIDQLRSGYQIFT